MRVVIDTNIWVSATLNPHGHPAKLKEAWLDGRFESVISLELLEEIITVLTRPRIKDKYELASDEIEVTRKVIEQKSILEIPAQVEFKLRDPHDNYLVGLAVAGQADCIVTRDGDLLGDDALPNFLDKNRIRVMSVQRFLDFLDEQAN